MVVTDIVKKDNKKSLIFLDYDKAFSLYGSEVRKYNIKINEDIPETSYNEIMRELLPKRCMERALYILKNSDKTCNDMKIKLLQGDYPGMIIEEVIDKLLKWDYLNDERYAFNYVKYNIKTKSIKRISNELVIKGVPKKYIEKAFCEVKEEEDLNHRQLELIKKEFIKKKYDFEKNDKSELNKIYASLLRKGFRYDDIEKVYNFLRS